MKKDQAANEKERHRQVRRDAFTKLGLIFLGILLIADTIQLSRFGEIVERVDHYNQGMVDELGGFRQDIMSFGGDLNEMRSFLLLPTKDYSFLDDGSEISTEEEEKDASPTEQAMYQFLASYSEEKSVSENSKWADTHISELAGNETLKKAADGVQLKIGSVETDENAASFKMENQSGVAIFAVVILKKDGRIEVQSALGTKEISKENDISEISDYIAQHKVEAEKLKTTLEEGRNVILQAVADPEISKVAAEKKMSFNGQPEEDNEAITYSYFNSEGKKVIVMTLSRKDGKLSIGDRAIDQREQFKAALLETVNAADASTEMEKMITQRKKELTDIFSQTAFVDLLKTNNLTISAEPREEYNKLLYDVKTADGKTQFSFFIELSSGMLKVLKDDVETDLYSFLQDGSKKKP